MSKKKTGRPANSREDPGLRRVIAVAGSVSALANELRLSVQAVSQWEKIPIERCGDIERLIGVPRYVQRPDIFEVPKGTRSNSRTVAHAA